MESISHRLFSCKQISVVLSFAGIYFLRLIGPANCATLVMLQKMFKIKKINYSKYEYCETSISWIFERSFHHLSIIIIIQIFKGIFQTENKTKWNRKQWNNAVVDYYFPENCLRRVRLCVLFSSTDCCRVVGALKRLRLIDHLNIIVVRLVLSPKEKRLYYLF